MAEEQDALSKKNLEANETESEITESESVENEEEEEERPNFDIYLRESARIMADWIRLQKAEEKTLTTDARHL